MSRGEQYQIAVYQLENSTTDWRYCVKTSGVDELGGEAVSRDPSRAGRKESQGRAANMKARHSMQR